MGGITELDVLDLSPEVSKILNYICTSFVDNNNYVLKNKICKKRNILEIRSQKQCYLNHN